MRILTFFILIYKLRQTICGTLIQVSNKSISPYSQNKGETTYYQFQFIPQTIIDQNAFVEVTFPIEFLATSIPQKPECSIKKENDKVFTTVPCVTINNRVIRAQVDTVLRNIFTIVIGQIINPIYKEQSSQFFIRTTYLDVVQDFSDTFGNIGFTPPPIQLKNPQIYRISNYRISEGSSWEFQFETVNSYGPGNSLRFTFPEGYTSQGVGCDITGQYGKSAKAILGHNYRIVTCQTVNKQIGGVTVAKILNMVNPDFSGIMQGFKIEVLELDTSNVLETAFFGGNIQIEPGLLKLDYISSDQFKWSRSVYSFFINLVNPANSNDKLYLNFTNEWNLYAQNCTIIDGFQFKQNQDIYCYLIPEGNSYKIENFQRIDSTKRLVVSIEAESPHYESQYPVTINTYNTQKNTVIDLNTIDIKINGTYGVLEKLSVNPVQAPITLRAGQVGPLEITLFLKTQLPKTDVGTFGKFRIDIFPKIDKPDSVHGLLTCFFYADKVSGDNRNKQTCDTEWKLDKADRTTLIFYTPLSYPFKESEIPITITTGGAQPGQAIGVQLNPLVQRYVFHIHIWKYNGNIFDDTTKLPPGQPPDEVYFTEFVPRFDDIVETNPDTPMPDGVKPAGQLTKVDATIYTAGHYTNLQIEYTHKNSFISAYTNRPTKDRNYIIQIEFVGNAWDPYLGWSQKVQPSDDPQNDRWQRDKNAYGFISKHYYQINNYPCTLTGSMWSTGTANKASSCYLNITKSDDSLKQYPYLQVNVLQTDQMSVDKNIKITIPKILINPNAVDQNAVINFKLLEETPGQRDSYVIVCQFLNKVAFKVKPVLASFTEESNKLTLTQGNTRLNLVDTTYTYKFASGSFDKNNMVVLELPDIKFDYGDLTCNNGNCIKYPQPLNWITFECTSSSALTEIVVTKNFYTNPPCKTDYKFKAYIWDITNKQIVKIVTGTYSYPFLTMPGTYKSMYTDDTLYYLGNYVMNKIEFTPEEPLPDGGYVQFTFNCFIMNIGNNFSFKTNLSPLDTNLGVRYMVQNDNRDLILFNLATVKKGQLYSVEISQDFLPNEVQTCDGAYVIIQLGYQFKQVYSASNKVYQLDAQPLVNYLKTDYQYKQGSTTTNNIKLSDKTLKSFKVLNPIVYERTFPQYQSTDYYTGPLNYFFTPNYGIISQQLNINIQGETSDNFQCNPKNGYPTVRTNDASNILKVTEQSSCGGSLQISLSNNQQFSKDQTYEIEITSKYANYEDGIRYPKTQGYYELAQSLTPKLGDLATYSSSQFLYVYAPSFPEFTVQFAHYSKGVNNMFLFQFKVAEVIPAYSKGGRLQLEFPTYDDEGDAFKRDLKCDYDTNRPNIGCSFESIQQEVDDVLTATTKPFTYDDVKKKELQCVLVESLHQYDPVFIEIINFKEIAKDTIVKIYVARVCNPNPDDSGSVKNVRINVTLRVNSYKIDNNNGKKLYLNSSSYRIFLNLLPVDLLNIKKTETPPDSSLTGVVGEEDNVAFTPNSSTFNHKIYTGYQMQAGDYYITELNDQNIFYLSYEKNQGKVSSCDTSVFEFCLLFEQANWIIWKLKGNISATSAKNAEFKLYSLSKQILLVDYIYYSYTWIKNIKTDKIEYNERITHKIPKNSWDSTQGTLTATSYDLASWWDTAGGVGTKAVTYNTKRVDVVITFTTAHVIPSTGSILIVFDSTKYNKIYPYCKSFVSEKTTQLYTNVNSLTPQEQYGELGCSIQNNLSWYITGFNQIKEKLVVKIVGQIDIPASSPGKVSIYTYTNQHDTNIFTNGNIIDKVDVNPTFTTNDKSLKVDPQIFLLQSEPLRTGYKGIFKFQLSKSNVDKQIIFTFQMGGFISIPTAKRSQIVCFAQGVNDPEIIIPLYFEPTTLYTEDLTKNWITIKCEADSWVDKANDSDYVISIGYKDANNIVTGLDGFWPTSTGIYSVAIQSGTFYTIEYIEVYPPPFQTISFKSTNNLKGQPNLIRLVIQPSVSITLGSTYLVVEFNTKSIDGQNLFANSFDSSNQSVISIKSDAFLSGQTSPITSTCSFNKGNQNNSIPTKLVCYFDQTIANTKTLTLYFSIKNPSPALQYMYIPIIVYTQNKSTTSNSGTPTVTTVTTGLKQNWSIIENAYLLLDDNSTTNPTFKVDPDPSTGTSPFSTKLGIAFNTPAEINANQILVLKMNKPILDKPPNSGALCQSGTLAILNNQNTIVCEFTAKINSSNEVKITNLITYLPSLSLYSDPEREIIGWISSDDIMKQATKINSKLNDIPLPSATAQQFTLDMNVYPTIGFYYMLNQDFLFKITQGNLQGLKKLVLKLPSQIDLAQTSTTTYCEQYLDAVITVVITSCKVEKIGSDLFVNVYIDDSSINDQNEKTIQFITINRALKFINASTFKFANDCLKLLIWQGSTEPTNPDTFMQSNQLKSGTQTSFTINSNQYDQNSSTNFIEPIQDQYIINSGKNIDATSYGSIEFKVTISSINTFSSISIYGFSTGKGIESQLQLTTSAQEIHNSCFLICKINNQIYSNCIYDSYNLQILINNISLSTTNSDYTISINIMCIQNFPQQQGFTKISESDFSNVKIKFQGGSPDEQEFTQIKNPYYSVTMTTIQFNPTTASQRFLVQFGQKPYQLKIQIQTKTQVMVPPSNTSLNKCQFRNIINNNVISCQGITISSQNPTNQFILTLDIVTGTYYSGTNSYDYQLTENTLYELQINSNTFKYQDVAVVELNAYNQCSGSCTFPMAFFNTVTTLSPPSALLSYKINQFYTTSKIGDCQSQMFLELSKGSSSTYGALEVIIHNVKVSDLPNSKKEGDFIKCQIFDSSGEKNNYKCQVFSRSPYEGSTVLQNYPYYGIKNANQIQNTNSDNLVIRITASESIADTIKISLEDMTIPDINNPYFTFTVQHISASINPQFVALQKSIKQVFPAVFKIGNKGSSCVTLQTSSDSNLSFSSTLQCNAFGFQFATPSATCSLVSTSISDYPLYKNSYLNKAGDGRHIIRICAIDGYYLKDNNNAYILNKLSQTSIFQEYFNGAGESIRYLWHNSYTNCFYGQTGTTTVPTQTQFTINIKSLANPYPSQIALYKTSPTITFQYFVDSQNTDPPTLNQFTLNQPLFSTFSANTNAVTINSQAPLNRNLYFVNQVKLLLQITIDIGGSNSKDLNTNLNYMKAAYFEIKATQGITKFLEVVNFAYEGYGLPISIIDDTTLHLGCFAEQKSGTSANLMAIEIFVQPSDDPNQQIKYQINARINFDLTESLVWNREESSNKKYDIQSGLTQMTRVYFPLKKYFPHYYERQITQVLLNSQGVSQLNFLLTNNEDTSLNKITIVQTPNVIDADKTKISVSFSEAKSNFEHGIPVRMDFDFTSGNPSTCTFTFKTSYTVKKNTKYFIRGIYYPTTPATTIANQLKLTKPELVKLDVEFTGSTSYKDRTLFNFLDNQMTLKEEYAITSIDNQNLIKLTFKFPTAANTATNVYGQAAIIEFNQVTWGDIGSKLKTMYSNQDSNKTFFNGKNHDCQMITEQQGFKSECIAQFGEINYENPFRIVVFFNKVMDQAEHKLEIPYIQNNHDQKHIYVKLKLVQWTNTNTYPIVLGQQVAISQKKFTNNPATLTCKVKSVDFSGVQIQKDKNQIKFVVNFYESTNKIPAFRQTDGYILIKLKDPGNPSILFSGFSTITSSDTNYKASYYPMVGLIRLEYILGGQNNNSNVDLTIIFNNIGIIANEIQEINFDTIYAGNYGDAYQSTCPINISSKPKYKDPPVQIFYQMELKRGNANLYSEGVLRILYFNSHIIYEGSKIYITIPTAFEPSLPLGYQFLMQTQVRNTLTPDPTTKAFPATEGKFVKFRRQDDNRYIIEGFQKIDALRDASDDTKNVNCIQFTIGFKAISDYSYTDDTKDTNKIKIEVIGPYGGQIEQVILSNTQKSGLVPTYYINPSGAPLIKQISQNFKYVRYADLTKPGPFSFQFKLRNFSLTSFQYTDQKLTFTLPNEYTPLTTLSTPPSPATQFYIRYKSEKQPYWIYIPLTSFTRTIEVYAPQVKDLPLDYPDSKKFDIVNNVLYTVIIDSDWPKDPLTYPDITVFKYFLFDVKVLDLKATPQLQESKMVNHIQEPLAIKSTDFAIFQALSTKIDYRTIYKCTFYAKQAASAGDEIWIELESTRYAFSSDQASNDYIGSQYKRKTLDCTENKAKVISDEKLICELFIPGEYGKRDVWPKIRILIKKPIVEKAKIVLAIGGLQPSKTQVVGAKISIRKKSSQPVDFPLLPSQIDYHYYVPTSYGSGVSLNEPSKGTDVTKMEATGTTYDEIEDHKFNIVLFQAASADDWISIYYTLANNSNMSKVCAYDGSECFVFPTLGQLIFKLKSGGDYLKDIVISELNNGLYRYAGQYDVEHWDKSGNFVKGFKTYGIRYEYDNVPQNKLKPDQINKFENYDFIFQPTLTPPEVEFREKYWLADFMNIAQIKIKGFWRYPNIKSIWFTLPRQIEYFDKSYCNATMSNPNNDRKPYPWNFNCIVQDREVGIEVTDAFPPFQYDNHDKYEMNIYVRFFIKEFAQPIETDCFHFASSVLPLLNRNIRAGFSGGNIDEDEGVTYFCKTIFISPYVQPNLKDLTFNTLSFYDRKARPNQNIELYMLLQPKTPVSLYKVDQIKFRIADEYNYPPIQYFNDCMMIGQKKNVINECKLERKYSNTYITVKPDISYDHSVKIIRIRDTDPNRLLKSPILPGSHYNITAELYSTLKDDNSQRLLEKMTKNITAVIGYQLPVDSYKIKYVLDTQRQSLFIFSFKIGSQIAVPAGYDSEFATVYSSIDLIFDTTNAFLKDLGSGLNTGDELGCISTKLQTTVKKRLKCTLRVGTGPDDLPTIIVQNYEALLTGQDVDIWVTNIQTLASQLKGNARVAVKFYFKKLNVQTYVYDPLPTLIPTEAELKQTSNTVNTLQALKDMTAPDVSTNKVWDSSTYEIKLDGAETMQATDFLLIKFPDDYFYRFSDYSGVTATINGSDCDKYVFGISNLIYLQPKSSVTGTLTIQVKNLINPAYTQSSPVTIIVQQEVNRYLRKTWQFQLTREIKPCENSFPLAQAVSDITVGGQNGMGYKFYFVIGHSIPNDFGAVSVVFPASYKYNLYTMEAKCRLLNFPEDSPVSCTIGSSNRVDVFLNGYQYSLNDQYGVEVYNVNSPNEVNADLYTKDEYKFRIISYYDKNIYLNRQVCKKDFPFPVFSYVPTRQCSIIVESQFLNVKKPSMYTFRFQCTDAVRQNTDIEIILHNNYRKYNGNNVEVVARSLEADTLMSSKCLIAQTREMKYTLTCKVRSIPSQKGFTIQTTLTNPEIDSLYTYSANLYSYGLQYAQAFSGKGNQYGILIQKNLQNQDPIVQNPDSLQVKLFNIQKMGGLPSTYIIRIPPLKDKKDQTIDKMKITFPKDDNHFAKYISDPLKCGVYTPLVFDESFITYKGLLEMTQGREKLKQKLYSDLPCEITNDFEITITIQNKKIDTNWNYWIIKNVINPSQQLRTNTFELTYQSNSLIIWSYKNYLMYLVSAPPPYLKVTGIKVDTQELRTFTRYEFSLEASQQIQRNPKVGISIQLPSELYTEVASQIYEPLKKCTIQADKMPDQEVYCDIYGLEVFIQDVNLQQLQGQKFKVVLNKMINPDVAHTCTYGNKNQFLIRLMLMTQGDYIMATSPTVDSKNCLEFKQQGFDIFVTGPRILTTGLAYTFKLLLSQPADKLTVTPYCSISGIKFSPENIQLNNYLQTEFSFEVKVRSDVPVGEYVLRFEKLESLGQQFYLPIASKTIKVVSLNDKTQVQPTVTIPDIKIDSLGYPIRVPVIISTPPANLLQLTIQVVEDKYFSLVSISPSKLQINPDTTSSYFEITVNAIETPEEPVTIEFSLSSFYRVVHQIVPPIKYISFTVNREKQNTYYPLHIVLSKNKYPTPEMDLKKKLVNSVLQSNVKEIVDQQKSLCPKIISLKQLQDLSTPNSETFQVFSSSDAYVYVTYSFQGSPKPKDVYEIIKSQYQYAQGYLNDTISTVWTSFVDHSLKFTLNNLEAQNNYVLYVFLINSMGYSDISSFSFKTKTLSLGYTVQIPIKEIVDPSELIKALSMTLRIPENRFTSQTDMDELRQKQKDFNPDIMTKSNYIYQVCIAPNSQNDNPTPQYYADKLVEDKQTQQTLKKLLPLVDISQNNIINYKIQIGSPTIAKETKMSKIGYYSATFQLKLWEIGNVFAILKTASGDSSNAAKPLSTQIFKGLNENNEKVPSKYYFNKKTDKFGNIEITFDNLNDNTEYNMYLTIGNNLPYNPLILYEDNQVRVINFKTPQNLNILTQEEQLNIIKTNDERLYDFIKNKE